LNTVVKIVKELTMAKTQTVFQYLKRHPDIIDSFLNHLEASALPDYLVRLISIDSETPGVVTQQWLTEVKLIEKLVGKFAASNANNFSDVVQTFMDVILASPWGSPLMNKITSDAISKSLFQTITDTNNPRAFQHGMRVFIRLIRGFTLLQDTQINEADNKYKFVKPDFSAPIDKLPWTVQILVKNFSKFDQLLKNPTLKKKFKNQTGQTFDTFGFERLVILEMIEALISLNCNAVKTELLSSQLFATSIDLLINKFPYNSFCHKSVETIFVRYIEKAGPEIQMKFFEKFPLAKILVDEVKKATEKTKTTQGKSKQHDAFPQYLAFLNRLVCTLHDMSLKSATLQTLLEVVPGWKDLSHNVIEERTKIEIAIKQLKGEDPSLSQQNSVPESDSDSYEDGLFNEKEDLTLSDDQDLDSTNDEEDYETEQVEILLTKIEVQAYA
jgi:hypothetical protein